MKKAFQNNDLNRFFLLWGSQTVSALGTAMTNFALVIWVYEQNGTASSITLLSVCAYLPSVLFCFIAGAIADRCDKKRIMLTADLLAAIGTMMVLCLYTASALCIWHLYIINFVLSFMNAFQNPASYVATSLLIPKDKYIKASGLQTLSVSVITILAPAFGSALMAFGGLKTVLLIDLATFACAFVILKWFINLPKISVSASEKQLSFTKSCMQGISFLKEHTALLKIILFFAFINFISKMGSYGMISAFVLARTGNDRIALGMVETAIGIGMLLGSILVTWRKPGKSRIKTIFFSCGISFLLGDVGQSIARTLPLNIIFAFMANVPMAFLNANLTAIMRSNVPIQMQGRVFSARDTLQFSALPIGLLLGGFLADHVFEPFMTIRSPLTDALSALFGLGKGSGIAIMFFVVGLIGTVTSFLCLKNPTYKTLDELSIKEVTRECPDLIV